MTSHERADTPVAAEVVASPNHGERRNGRRPDMLLLHYTGMPRAEEALAWLCNPASGVSSHYFVFEDGRVTQLVPEARRAWHAGAGSWGGDHDINSCSIGIEIVNPGHDFGYPEFPEQQIAAVIVLCRDILARHAISADRVVAHSDIAPARKQDPGEKFPWRLLAESGVGEWVTPSAIDDKGPNLAIGDESDGVRGLQLALADFGYGVPVTGIFDELTRDVVTAFQRHFRPEKVDGIADGSTLRTLHKLLQQRLW